MIPKRILSPALAGVVVLGLSAISQPGAARPDFAAWLDGVRQEGVKRGLSVKTLDAALKGLKPIPKVIERDRHQPEFTMTFGQYMARVVSAERIAKGKQRLADNRVLLAGVAARYGVQPRFIVALWGIESDYGRLQGGFSVIGAVATLAYEGRRSAYFRKELFAALRIVDQGHVTAARMTGSWAGAMGQNQFMPTSFLAYAVDHDGDEKRDIWTSRADVFASSANYLASFGWRKDQGWGRLVRLPAKFDPALADLKIRKPVSLWREMGVRGKDGKEIPERGLEASVILPQGPGGPALLVYGNFRTLLRWNRSIYFAAAVGRLADAIFAR